MVAHSMTKNLQDLKIKHLFLIVSHNDQNIKQLLYFVWTEIVPYWLIKSMLSSRVQRLKGDEKVIFIYSRYFHLTAKVTLIKGWGGLVNMTFT